MSLAELMKVPARVVRVLNQALIVINQGSIHGIKAGDRFLIYHDDPEELIDPNSGKSLGHLEIVRGTGTAVHVQDSLTTIRSLQSQNPYNALRGLLEVAAGSDPFEGVKVGDLARLR
jgi:hypothetical protein